MCSALVGFIKSGGDGHAQIASTLSSILAKEDPSCLGG